MSPRINFEKNSQEHIKKLLELSFVKTAIEPKLKDLINIRASQLNGCAFCLDMHVKEAKIHGERELRLYHIPIWSESPLFTEKEKAALYFTEAVTNLSNYEEVTNALSRIKEYFNEKEVSDITFLIGTINMWNRLNAVSQNTPGALDEAYGLTKAGLN